MIRLLAAATRYCALIFALGFVLGAARVMVVAPRLGEALAVLIEAPLMLLASAWWARRVLRSYAVQRPSAAAVLGGMALAELMVAELLLARSLAGKAPAEWLADMTHGAGLIGLGAQLCFGLMPAAILLYRAKRKSA